jgi:parallel beta-helix repeat protein
LPRGKALFKRFAPIILSALLLTNLLTLTPNVRTAEGTWTGTVYIRADGSIDPPGAPIITFDNATYTLTGNISSTADAIVVERDNIVIDGYGYTLNGSRTLFYSGIKVFGRCNVTIKNFDIQNFGCGICLSGSSNNSVIGNNIKNNYDGIGLSESSNNYIVGNNIISNDDCGIYLSRSSNCGIVENIIMANDAYGIFLLNSSHNSIIGNNVTNNYSYSILFDHSSNNVLSENIIYRGLFLEDSQYNHISSNFISAVGIAIWLTGNSSGNVIAYNTVTQLGKAGESICLDDWSNYNIIIGNYMENEEDHNIVCYTDYNLICDNILIGGGNYIGMSIGGKYNVLHNNTIYNYYQGLTIWTENNTITSNLIVNNHDFGVFIGGNGNTFRENTIQDNGRGLEIQGDDNLIFHNNIINNTLQVKVYRGINKWDNGYPSGGNYWSDYSGVDADGDGLGDTPYIVDENNVDHYPLMKPYVPKLFDLAIENIELSNSNPEEGELIAIKVTIKNLGERSSGPWTVRVLQNVSFSNPITVNRIETIANFVFSDPLNPGESKALEIPYNAIQVINSEGKELCVELSSIGDANATNNKRYISLNIKGVSFKMDRDAYSFENWAFSPEELVDLRRQLEIILKEFPSMGNILLAILYPIMASGGHCFGMASTSILYYTGTISKPMNKETFYMTKDEAAPNIAAYHVSQWPYILKIIVQELRDSVFGYNLTREYEKIKEILSRGKLPLMLITLSDGPRHAIAVFDIYDLNKDQKNVITYDNNVNGESTIYIFDLNNNKIYCDYISRRGYRIKSVYIDEPAPYTSDIIQKIINDFIKALTETGKRIISFGSPVNVVIIDEFGRKISKGANEIPGAFMEYYPETDTKIFYLPLNLTYYISLNAEQEGTCTITEILPAKTNQISFSQLTFNLTENTMASFRLQPNTSEYVLQVDENGDGTVDSEKEPEIGYYQTTETSTYPINIDGQEFSVDITSNSTITDFSFIKDEMMIKFTLKGINNTIGFCNVTIPKGLLRGEPWSVRMNGNTWNYRLTENETHSSVYFNYIHVDVYEVTIEGTWVIPEFPSIIMCIMLILSILIASCLRKTKRKRNFSATYS